MSTTGELSYQEVLHGANRSYEKLLHASLGDDDGRSAASGAASIAASPAAAGRSGVSAASELHLAGKSPTLSGAGAAAGTSSVNSAHLQFANDVLASCRAAGSSSSAVCLTASSSWSPASRSLRASTPTSGSRPAAAAAVAAAAPPSASERYSSASKLRGASTAAGVLGRQRSSSPTGLTKMDGLSSSATTYSSPSSPRRSASAGLALSPVPAASSTVGVQAAVDSLKLSPLANGSSKSASTSPGGGRDYSYVSTDNIRELQSIRHSLKHVLHGDMAGVEELLTSRLAHIKRQEAANVESAVRTSSDVTHLINTSLHSENQLLRDTLDRERYRRKQFEKQTETLQGRLGEEQEQFTAALAALKKKDGMIDQLDKTLAKVVEGWQSHEGETQRYIEQLEKTQRQLAHDLSEQREVAASLEVDLSSAVDDLAREQERAALSAFDKNNKLQLLEEELRRLTDSLEAERGRTHRLELDRSAAAEGRDRVEQALQTVQTTLAEERAAFQEREQELIAKIDEISGIQITVLENEQKKAAEQERHLLSTESRLAMALRDAQNLSAKLEEAELDKERAAADLATLKAKHEAQLKQQEADLRLQTADVVLRLRQEWAERLSEREAELSGVHRQQVGELHERHARQTQELTARHHSELAELRARYQLQVAELGHKIDELEEEVHSLRYTKRKMEAQSKEMTTRLQSMMTMHASEALKILTNTTPSPPATSGALALKAEVSTALSHHGLHRRPQSQAPVSIADRLPLPPVPPPLYEGRDGSGRAAAAAVREVHGLPSPAGEDASARVAAHVAAPERQQQPEEEAAAAEEDGASGAAAQAELGNDAAVAAAAAASLVASAHDPTTAAFANGNGGKQDAEDGNGDDFEDDGESYASADTYGNTPRSDDPYGSLRDDVANDGQRQQALQSYIHKVAMPGSVLGAWSVRAFARQFRMLLRLRTATDAVDSAAVKGPLSWTRRGEAFKFVCFGALLCLGHVAGPSVSLSLLTAIASACSSRLAQHVTDARLAAAIFTIFPGGSRKSEPAVLAHLLCVLS